MRSLKQARFAATASGLLLAGGALLAQAVAGAPVVDKTLKVAPGLYEVVASPSRGLVYVASVGSRQPEVGAKILGLDPTSLAVKQTIDVGQEPAFGLGINDRTQTLYTTNTRNGSVSAIDLKSSKVVGTIKVEADPKAHLFRLLVDEERNVVYASVTGGRVWVIDGKTNTLSHVIEDVGKTTVGLALDAAGNRLFAANMGSGDIAVIDLASRKIVTRFAVPGDRPTMLAFDAAKKRLFVTNQGSGDVTVVDATNGQSLKTIKTGGGALGIAFNPATNLAYVANRQAGTITVIDTAALKVVADLPAGSLPNTVALDAKTNRVYVTNKAKSAGRDAPPVDDPAGDTVTIVQS
jgi:YVTN family beta-propeller protein